MTDQNRCGRWVTEVADRQVEDREKPIHALQEFLALNGVHPYKWCIKQRVYCNVGLIPGGKEN